MRAAGSCGRTGSASPNTHRGALRGFTLAEIMVAILLSGIVITALSSMWVTSSYVFHTQEQVAATQMNLRYAIHQVKEDIRRAGMQSSPNSQIDRLLCPRPEPPVFGIAHFDAYGSDAAVFDFDSNRGVVPDRLVLSGNFSSSSSYPARVAGQQVIVSLPAWTGDPKWEPAVYRPDAFLRIFREDQFLRLTNSYGTGQIVPIQSVAAGPVESVITLADLPRMSNGGTCGITGGGDDVEVNPVNFIEYSIEPREPGATDDVDTVLVRNYLDSDGDILEGADLVVGERIVDFQVWFMLKNGDDTGAPTILADTNLFDDVGNRTDGNYTFDGSASSRPDLIRTAIVRVCARTAREDWPYYPRDDTEQPLLSFDLDDNTDNGAARVMCLSSEVEVTNHTLRNLRP